LQIRFFLHCNRPPSWLAKKAASDSGPPVKRFLRLSQIILNKGMGCEQGSYP